jgi:hypothetical protein
MPRTRSGKEHDPVKAAEAAKRRLAELERVKQSKLRMVEREAKAAHKKVMSHLKSAVTKKQKVGSIKMKKVNGGKKTRRGRRV